MREAATGAASEPSAPLSARRAPRALLAPPPGGSEAASAPAERAFAQSRALSRAFARRCAGSSQCTRDWNFRVWHRCGAGTCSCASQNRGLPSERLFDGERLRPELFGMPEWELDEFALNF